MREHVVAGLFFALGDVFDRMPLGQFNSLSNHPREKLGEMRAVTVGGDLAVLVRNRGEQFGDRGLRHLGDWKFVKRFGALGQGPNHAACVNPTPTGLVSFEKVVNERTERLFGLGDGDTLLKLWVNSLSNLEGHVLRTSSRGVNEVGLAGGTE